MRWKQIFLLLLILSSSLLLTGCPPTVQLNERAIVQAVGIDWADDQYHLTLQVFSPSNSGGGSISATSENAKIIECDGQTLSDAMQNATMTQGKQLFVGHNRIIILGSEAAKQGVELPLAYFSADPWARQNVHLAVAEKNASDILKAKINQGILPAETLERILSNASISGMTPSVKMYEFLRALNNKHESAFLPTLTVQQQDEGGSGGGGEGGGSGGEGGGSGGKSDSIEPVSSIAVVGTAIFSEAKLATILDKRQSRGLLWLRNMVNTTNINVRTEKYESASLKVYESTSTLLPDITEQDIRFTLQVVCRATLGESKLKQGEGSLLNDIVDLENAGEEEIRQECLSAFQTAVTEYGSDIFNFGNLLWKKEADTWRELREDWPELVPEIQLEVDVQLKLDRIGIEFDKKAKNESEPSSKAESSNAE